ncbi:DUF1467 family protein [Actibacterium lipolyticum]|uniref:DUF1467 domain-containing protein n=1 Tax=Actibacterium lipolyticum TaxID=1524263 RepID=A0A238JMA9_9RHOB|nr:DUF1467 family protein [Actibacterium lipolyticum]SMX31810.1 hypothetical protein COL8621_00613 [Actibacterium lipolyticum]
MGITSAIVLFAVIWFMVLFITLPIRLRTQGDEGEVVPGTHAGAPANFNPKRTAKIVTMIAVVLWVIIAGTIQSGVIKVSDFDGLNRLTIKKVGGTDE